MNIEIAYKLFLFPHIQQEQMIIQFLAQGHFNMWTGATNLTINDRIATN